MKLHQEKVDAKQRNSRGVTLIIALLTLLLLSTLLAALLFSSNSQIWTSSNYRLATQARYTAEVGAQNAINWLNYTYTKPPGPYTGFDMTKSPVQYNNSPVVLSAMSGVTANYPDATQQNAFNAALNNIAVSGMQQSASYSVYATLLRMRSYPVSCFGAAPALSMTWQITSQGTLTGGRNATTQIVETYDNPPQPCLSYAVYATSNACSSINFLSGGSTNSFDSSLPGPFPAGVQNTGGNLGTPGNLMNQSSLTIGGTLSTPGLPQTGSCPGSAASGTSITFAPPPNTGFQTLTPPSLPTPPIPPKCTSGCLAMSHTPTPGNYGDITGCSGTYTFAPGTYNFNSIDCSSAATFNISSPGQVIINIAGAGSSGYALNFQSGLSVNAGGVPSNFQIVYGGTAGLNFQSGASPINALIYAPNANLDFQSQGDFYGAMVTNSVNIQSIGAIHYDRALQRNMMTQGSYHPVSFSRSKY